MDEIEKKNIMKHKQRRRNKKIKLGVQSIVLIMITIALLGTYFKLSKNEYNNYKEKAQIHYKAKLKENEFYTDEYLEEGSTIIASLIQDIEVEFKYNMELEQSQDYEYSYKILAKTNVKQSTRANSIYETTEELVNKEVQESNNEKLEINENITIDYNEYNEKINKFINLYHLDNTTNTIELEMYVSVINKYDGTEINQANKVMSLSIPLTTRTIDVSIGSNVVQDNGKTLIKRSEYQNIDYLLWIGIIVGILAIIWIIRFIKYMIDTRSAEKMYEQELKRIMFNYKSYIQQTDNEINQEGYKIIRINTFNEILGLRDTIQSPILMYTEEKELRTQFTIIKDGIIYVYILGAKEIREELRAKSAQRKKKEKITK